jgi:hypothetical protein
VVGAAIGVNFETCKALCCQSLSHLGILALFRRDRCRRAVIHDTDAGIEAESGDRPSAGAHRSGNLIPVLRRRATVEAAMPFS